MNQLYNMSNRPCTEVVAILKATKAEFENWEPQSQEADSMKPLEENEPFRSTEHLQCRSRASIAGPLYDPARTAVDETCMDAIELKTGSVFS